MGILPPPRGPLSEAVITALREPAGAAVPPLVPTCADPLADDDLHLALYCCYELAYRGFSGVDDGWEWDPGLLAARRALEEAFEAALVAELGPPPVPEEPVTTALRAIAEGDSGPSLSRHLEREGTVAQVHEFLVHRSAYQLKEADPHSFVVPRLTGVAKSAVMDIQFDEYGGGRPERAHAQLFANVLASLGLDPTYGTYLPVIPGVTLATVNLMSLFGLHRRWRGALCGHLALFEMTSTVPNRRYANGLRRLGLTDPATLDFFDEHVEADSVHEQLALHQLAGGLAKAQPDLAGDVIWGARALDLLDRRWATAVLGAWTAGRTSLLAPLGTTPELATAS